MIKRLKTITLTTITGLVLGSVCNANDHTIVYTNKMENPNVVYLTLTMTDDITISPGIVINTRTGKVTVPPDVSIPEAARTFWFAVAAAFPSAKQAILEEALKQDLKLETK